MSVCRDGILRMESCDWRKKVGFWGSKANEEKAKSRHFELEMVSKGVERVHFVGECVSRWHFKNGIV